MKVGTGFFVTALLFGAQASHAQSSNNQAIYDAAQTAFDKSDWAGATTGFSQLLPKDDNARLSRSQSVIASRYASALVRLNRLDEASTWIDRALPALPTDDPAQIAEAYLTRGDVARYGYDYTGALAAYRKADQAITPLGLTDLLVTARIDEALVGATLEPAFVQTQLADLSALPDFAKKVSPTTITQIVDLQARAAINAGDNATAAKLADRAVDASGGLSTRVSLRQIAIRADAGVIARLNHDDTKAQMYLAYTGAGHLKETSWIKDHSGELPVCGDYGEGIRPDDSAVVSFAIAENGRVAGALPTYASRPGQIGVAFARAISTWSWSPDDLKKIDPFWRVADKAKLPDDDPLASVALLHQAIGFERTGDAASAKASLQRSGLTEQKCSLIDTHPIAQERRVSSENYPDAAQRWSFEGFAQEAFDIADDGSVKNVRTVVAYRKA